jgi:glycosyltransferase involved in cell wall biosynthesis
MADQPRFILTTPVLAWPTDQGSKYFQLEVARGLLSLGPVTWITREIGDQAEAIDRLRVEGFDLRLDRSFRDRSPLARVKRRIGIDFRALQQGVARDEAFVCSPGVRRLVGAARREFPDAFGAAVYWSATPALEGFARGRRIYAVSDIDSVRESRGPNPLGRRFADSERRALQRVDLALTLSDEDRRDALTLLEGAPAPEFGRCPVSIEIPADASPPSPGGELLLYGHWEAPFNRDGLTWFLREVWPVLREHPGQPRLRIVGKGEPESIEDSRVEWVGFVEDLAVEIARARAVLIPLRYASGLRYRLLESFAHGRAVIATGVAARGSGAEPGRHFLQADAPDEWRVALDQVDDRLGIDAREWVTKNHSRAGLADRWAAALAPLLSS